MKLDLEKGSGHVIRSFSGTTIMVGTRAISRPVVITPDRIIDDWLPATIQELTLAHMEPILELDPELILLGTGRQQVFPPMNLSTAILQRGIGLEVMTTVAACRTFNVLAGELRRVAAALFISD